MEVKTGGILSIVVTELHKNTIGQLEHVGWCEKIKPVEKKAICLLYAIFHHIIIFYALRGLIRKKSAKCGQGGMTSRPMVPIMTICCYHKMGPCG